ncbi:MAG: hypothetical protein QM793_05830 [Muricomes sp.]
MHPKNFVICDVEQEYAGNLVRAIGARKELDFQTHLFHDLESLEEFSRQKNIHIMLLGQDYPVERRQEIKADKRYVLVKGDGKGLLSQEKGIYKYQSCDMILSCIFEEITDEEGVTRKNRNASNGKLIGIYSPIHRIGKTKFAMSLGEDFAKDGSVLYLNLEEYSGCSHYFPENESYNLGDLLYYIRQEKGSLGLRISAMAGRVGRLDYISPIPVIQDLRSVKEEEWIKLFEEIFANCIYGTIILDLGDGVDGLYSILRMCYTVYTPYIEDAVSQAKMGQYVNNLRQTGYEDVLEHTIQKKMETRAGEFI